jgi:phosphoribosylaminoimidazolecarboxamide formyltransferase/IMP cyclohydrolase
MIKVKRALISVSDKAGVLDFARGLNGLGIEILSTGGTARLLKSAGLNVKEVSDYTGFPEILDGRVKTLHPSIHGGLLALRDKPKHLEQLKKRRIGLIDLIVVNLYPFKRVTSKKNVTLEEALENIDIGGPSMIRSAAKNFKSVAVICNPKRYKDILKELEFNSGLLSDAVLRNLAIEAFGHTAQYDSAIFEFLNTRLKKGTLSGFPEDIAWRFKKIQDLRYGENPHQEAAFYGHCRDAFGLSKIKQLNGKELSFNNLLDLNAAVGVVKDFDKPAAVIIKHNNPTGVCEDESLTKAFQAALRCDPVSAFGGIIGLNKKVDLETAKGIQASGFMECVIAPGFDKGSLKLLSKKKNLRIIQIDLNDFNESIEHDLDFKSVIGGLLLQEKDTKQIGLNDLKVVTKQSPSATQMESLLFGWKVIKHIRSNAVILVKGKKTVGIGCGQTSRVESTKLAIKKAGKNAKNALMVSDAFIPKKDNIAIAAKAGIKAVIQSGGSISDNEVVKEADKFKIAMVTTGTRHFKH